MNEPLSVVCGQILVVGFPAAELSAGVRRSLQRGERGGVVLFKRNVENGIDAILELTRAVRDASSREPPLISIDQEGGRVARIGPPALVLPPMRTIGDLGDTELATRLAEAQGRELAALGITMNYAPVADVHTRPENPVIGNRAFATTPADVARFAAAWARGLARANVLSCAKHFPGHGDTTVDSHLALPRVDRSREELERSELAPFRALAKEPAIASMMVAHVVFPALDPEARPSSLSPAVCTDLLRRDIGFDRVIFTDDLEMKAIQIPIAEAVILAVRAGCDALLVCHGEDLAEAAHEALVREAESSPAFRARCVESSARFTAMRRRAPPAPVADGAAANRVFESSHAVAAELASRVASLAAGTR